MGLIRTALKTAVAVKTAHVVHDRIQRRQGEKWASEHPLTAPPPSPSPSQAPAVAAAPDRLTQLAQLGELRTTGVLTDAEFESEKARILAG
jgi:hypothetical protein